MFNDVVKASFPGVPSIYSLADKMKSIDWTQQHHVVLSHIHGRENIGVNVINS
jgi:hypothetical protein